MCQISLLKGLKSFIKDLYDLWHDIKVYFVLIANNNNCKGLLAHFMTQHLFMRRGEYNLVKTESQTKRNKISIHFSSKVNLI